MPLEGKLGSFNFSHETIVTDDHPGVLRSLMLDETTVTASLAAGTLLKSVVNNEIDGAAYTVCTEADTPAAVLAEDFNPGEKTYATCLVHGTVKAEFLKVGEQKPKLAMLDKLMAAGIFTV